MAEDTKEPSFVPMDEIDNSKNSSNASSTMEDVSLLTDPLAPSSSLSPETGDFNSATIFTPATLNDFDDEVPEEERQFCLQRYSDLNTVKQARMHCTSCNKHLGLTSIQVNRLKMHPMLRTLMCKDCLNFYNSGEFSKGEDGSELYCRWCGQGGQVYCCSSCPVVFCAKCIRRNYGADKIEEIESIDDWNCFVCAPKVLWCHRSALWAARRYCMLKNKLSVTTTDPIKRKKMQEECQMDESVCCKRKNKPKMLTDKKLISVKKFDVLKRQGSPIQAKKMGMQPIPIMSGVMNTDGDPPPLKKMMSMVPNTPLKIPIQNTKKMPTIELPHNILVHNRQKPKNTPYNGFVPYPYMEETYNSIIPNDHLNLSLDSLTAGLDMSRIPDMSSMHNNEDSVVCTPDFPMPMEPVCEVTEDDDCTEVAFQSETNSLPPKTDDVQCLTEKYPRLIPKPLSALISQTAAPTLLKPTKPMEIIKMSANDVSVNEKSGALKFNVNPSMLSTNKMYQLPDGRIFAVNHKTTMPGGYSATIISTSQLSSATADKRVTVQTPSVSQTPTRGVYRRGRGRRRGMSTRGFPDSRRPDPPKINDLPSRTFENSRRPTRNSIKARNSDVASNSNNPQSIEWYTYNLYDAVDLVDYVSKKLHKIKSTPVGNLRLKSVQDVKDLHYSLDQALKISCQRFVEIRNNLSSEFKAWIKEKYNKDDISDDDNVQITSIQTPKINLDEPIFIDENSNDSNAEKDDVIHIDSIVCDITTENEPADNTNRDEGFRESNNANRKPADADVPDPLLNCDNDMSSFLDESVQETNKIDENHVENDIGDKKRVEDCDSNEEFIKNLVESENSTSRIPVESESSVISENSTSENPIASEKPFISENPIVSEDPLELENSLVSGNPLELENSLIAENPLEFDNSIISENPLEFGNSIVSKNPLQPKNSVVTPNNINPTEENNIDSELNDNGDDISICENNSSSGLDNSKRMDIDDTNCDMIPQNVHC